MKNFFKSNKDKDNASVNNTPSVKNKIDVPKDDNENVESTPEPSKEEYEPTDLVIKEVMVQKNVTREEAIQILKNPSK